MHAQLKEKEEVRGCSPFDAVHYCIVRPAVEGTPHTAYACICTDASTSLFSLVPVVACTCIASMHQQSATYLLIML